MPLGVVVLVLVGLGNAVVALDVVPRALDELVVDADAAPAPYAVVPAQSGDLDAELTAAIGISDTLVEAADAGYIRTWQDPETGAVLRLVALRTNTERGAARSGEELGSALVDGGYEEFDVPDIDGARGASLVVGDGDQETSAAAVYFVRDRYLFLLAGGATSVGDSGTTPEQVRAQVHDLAVLQAEHLADAGLSRPAEDRGLAESVGSLLGALAGYLLIVGTIGYLRDPLRRSRARSTEAATPAAVDVAGEAQRQRLRAAALLAGELLAISLALGSALPGVAAGGRLALLAVAVALGVAVFLLRRTHAAGRRVREVDQPRLGRARTRRRGRRAARRGHAPARRCHAWARVRPLGKRGLLLRRRRHHPPLRPAPGPPGRARPARP